MPNDLIETNRGLWNRWTRIHERSTFYDLDGFRRGNSSLHTVEREELGDVQGKTLLHLQCHFGMDTLSWARLGARVTGVDLSDDAIALARSLARELGIPAEFVRSDLYALPEVLDGAFDIVHTSYGVLCWLPDLTRWAQVIARFLAPGGVFYMVEHHPILSVLDEEGAALSGRYFDPEPSRYETEGSYAGADPEGSHPGYEWVHPLGEVVTALAGVGLRLEVLHEFPYTVENYWATAFEEQAPGRYVLRGRPDVLPLMFSLRATRP